MSADTFIRRATPTDVVRETGALVIGGPGDAMRKIAKIKNLPVLSSETHILKDPNLLGVDAGTHRVARHVTTDSSVIPIVEPVSVKGEGIV